MIRDPDALRRWDSYWQKSNPSDPEANIRIFWTLLDMARDADAWPPQDPLEGLENDINLARMLNTYVEPTD
ncbi:MAG: hypothetical protein JRH06_10115 [Deltaproteobacteria bacterium]|nr:hypothetical protein [Deltaproteobacteria bacterium]MBW2137899.1 hypothetical protein [Deltaproteobacteria bacterium]